MNIEISITINGRKIDSIPTDVAELRALAFSASKLHRLADFFTEAAGQVAIAEDAHEAHVAEVVR